MDIKITHDGSIDIATGRSRKEVNWKNKEIQWSELVIKLSETHRTAESYNEYLSSKKPRQDEIKDIGGFVGGYLSNGRRKASNVVHRQLITLDIDFAIPVLWEDFLLLYDSAAVLYSTHKHSTDTPRFRLIIPLSRSVFADEYLAITRRIAGVLGIDLFDPTTYQPERLMYWPSTAKDGEYVFEYQDGKWMDADEILNSYHDWRDSSEWPMSEKENSIPLRAIKKQGDPLEKPGVVGAFCRTYGIAEVIDKYLGDVYEACDIPNRYSFKEGSTAAGLVVYDDKYAFSHHGTDPVSGKLCNAFDLVRLHKYGLKDEDAKEGTPGNKLPSYISMLDFSTKDPNVRKQLGSEMLQAARGDFAEAEEIVFDDDNDDWLAEMDVDRKGNYYSSIKNVSLILENDPKLKRCFGYDAFRQKKIVHRHLPWRLITDDTRYVRDTDEQNLIKYLEVYDITNRSNIKDAFDTHIEANSFHPVKEYLQSLKWDHEERVDTLLIDYIGAEDNDYTRAVTRKTLMAAVARIFQPGISFDPVLTLVGKQGIGKSTIIKKLGKQWYSDSFGNVETKEAVESIQGVWIMELGELAAFKKAEVDRIKHFISKKEDSFRPAYGRNLVTYKRQCIFIGTTNNTDFLRDPTGNRRFWPVPVMEVTPSKNIYTEFSDYEIDQVWAEAVELYKTDSCLYLEGTLNEYAEKMQEAHSFDSGQKGLIEDYLNKLLPDNWDEMDIYQRRSFLQGDDEFIAEGNNQRTKVCIAEIWCELFGKTKGDMNAFNTKDIHDIMRKIKGWKQSKGTRKFSLYGYQRAYEKTDRSVFVKKKMTNAEVDF